MTEKIDKNITPPMPEPKRSDEVPVTLRHLELVKQELKSDITTGSLQTSSLRLEMQAGFKKVEADVSQVQSSVFEIKSQMSQVQSTVFDMKSEMSQVQSTVFDMKVQMSQVQSSVFEMKALLEQQTAQNRVALDGYTSVYYKQMSTEERLGNLEKQAFGIEQK